MIAIIDYGVGNLFSLVSSLNFLNIKAKVTGDINEIKACDKIILPGVGAFKDAAEKLRLLELDKIIIEQANNGKNIMGICLGMQLLFENSFEYGNHKGLELLKGSVVPIENEVPKTFKIPQIGWNQLHFTKENALFKNIKNNDCVYFVHSYYAKTNEDCVIATCDYGKELTAAVAKNNVFGCQFHPEKSGDVGLGILKAFNELESL